MTPQQYVDSLAPQMARARARVRRALRRLHPHDRTAPRARVPGAVRADARERRRLRRRVRRLVLHARRDVLARSEAGRRPLSERRSAAVPCSGSRRRTGSSGSRRTASRCARCSASTRISCARSRADNEMMAILEEGLEDFSISRSSFDWGIPLPGGGVLYVWYDALINYISALGLARRRRRALRARSGRGCTSSAKRSRASTRSSGRRC